MRFLIINGPNLNMLSIRDKNVYGSKSEKELKNDLKKYAKINNFKIIYYQSNCEGKIIDFLNKNYNKFDGAVINMGAYTHYSYAIRDALEICTYPIVEVHISNINNREEFRKIDCFDDVVCKKIIGKGLEGYFNALKYLMEIKK